MMHVKNSFFRREKRMPMMHEKMFWGSWLILTFEVFFELLLQSSKYVLLIYNYNEQLRHQIVVPWYLIVSDC